MTGVRFPRIDLAAAPDVERELVLHGLFYRGLNNKIVGPTGSGKTLLATRLVLDALRDGEVPVHLDMEIGQGGTKRNYFAHGATAQELADIHYVEFPEPKLDEARDLAQSMLDAGETFALFDKKPDFLRSMTLRENDNDDQSDFYGRLIDPLREKVTTVMLAPTGHAYGSESDAGRRGRGGSESDYKYDAIWQLTVSEPFDLNRVGRIALRCSKDRWGFIGVGRVVEFDIGGDGGGIVFGLASSGFQAQGPTGASDLEDELTDAAVSAARAIASGLEVAKNDLTNWMDANLPHGRRGSRSQQLQAIDRAVYLPTDQDGIERRKVGNRGPNEVHKYTFRQAVP
ncbi:MAG: hypothetical protein U0667_14290 [Chloroflexota bacterium]